MRDRELEPLDPEVAVEQYLDSRRPSVTDSTYRNSKNRLGHFLDFLEEEEIDDMNDLTGRTLYNFVAWRRGDIAPITLQKQLSSLRVFLRWAADVEAVPEGLAEKVHSPELPDGAEARTVVLEEERAEAILEHLNRYEYASRRHVCFSLLWRTGMRISSLHALDLQDLRPDDCAVDLVNRPETDTRLKNGNSGERWVYLGPRWYQVVEDYVDANRYDVTDDHGREPLVTTKQGRAHKLTVQKWIYSTTRPCMMHDCPHDEDPQTCEAMEGYQQASKCPSSRSPHTLRRGAITSHLLDGVPPEVASERMDVSLEVLYRHYDARSPGEKMNQRKKFLRQ
ncbi:Site-specific recombinase XerD [Halogeometricum rufum]|uniref:Site-specific recombinase XerD n=1 Tax=Halogeometricum rufum TaxID=553469 RepID=A0A1I6G557_9EURY|nr:tyrosine-type recombinase/integrase [Halogeometricum rufum]SFR37250.1 Site-specific recombinase XerD [Halogeometricum rufum]